MLGVGASIVTCPIIEKVSGAVSTTLIVLMTWIAAFPEASTESYRMV